MNIFTQLYNKAQTNPQLVKEQIRQDLLRREAQIGKTLFGPIPKGHDREFFRIDAKTWIWQERWLQNGKKHFRETKYIVREHDILKSINGSPYQKVSLEEARNLKMAIENYAQAVRKQIYNS